MIKDKITPELKRKFSNAIKISSKTGKEYGFVLCKDKEGNLYATRTCTGTECEVQQKFTCPSYLELEGKFHTHPYVALEKKKLEKELGIEIPYKTAKKLVIEEIKREKRTVSEPSYGDTLTTLILRCKYRENGTTCIISDMEPSTLECWTTKRKINKKDCDTALKEFKQYPPRGSPRDWIKPLFKKEIIDLKGI